MGTMDADTASGCSEVLQALKRRNDHEIDPACISAALSQVERSFMRLAPRLD